MQIQGVHVLLYSRKPEEDRAFLADVLQLPAVDAGQGWLIFGLPPAEMAVHPSDDDVDQAEGDQPMLDAHVYLMCKDVRLAIAALRERNVACPPVATERWGLRTTIPLPSGGRLGLYQPTHPTAVGMV